MNTQQLENAIKSDMDTLSTFKMGIISARDFYGSLLGFVLKSSIASLLINTLVRLGLKGVGLYDGSITVLLMILMWVCCLGVSFFMGLAFSQPILMSKLLQGRLKTETFIKKIYRHLCVVYFCLYTVMYTLIILFVNLGFTLDQGLMDPLFLTLSAFFTQMFAFIFASAITGFISGSEFQRLGLGAIINLIGEVLLKARRQTQHTYPTKDA